MPESVDTVRGNRQFLVRAVAFLRDAGIRQFLDIGSGLPSSPNVHEVVQAGGTGARVVYTDHNQVVVSHAQALMAKRNEDTVSVVHADLRDAVTQTPVRGRRHSSTSAQPVALDFRGSARTTVP